MIGSNTMSRAPIWWRVSALVHWRWNQEKHVGYLDKRQPWNQLLFVKTDALRVVLLHRWKPCSLTVGGTESRCCSFDAFPPPEFVEILCRGWNLPCWGSSVFSTVNGSKIHPCWPHWFMAILGMGCISFLKEKHLEQLVWRTVDGRTLARVDMVIYMVDIPQFTGVFYISGG